MKNKILYGKQFIDQRDINSVKKSLREKFITTGKQVLKFENKLSETLKVKYALSCNSGTAGLHLAFLAINLKKNDIVIMPSINFISSYRVASLLGAKIYLTDVDPISGQMTPKNLIDCIRNNKLKKIKAVVTMYLGGYIKNTTEFYRLKKRFNFSIIEDACHAIGGRYTSKKKQFHIGSCEHSDLCVFSFHPVKTITTGEGGAVTTNNKSYAQKIKLIRSHGIIRKKKYWSYDIKELGFNYRLSDINCSLGLSQLKKIKIFQKKRKQIFDFYKKKLDPYKKVFKFEDNSNKGNSYHFFLLSINFKLLRSTKEKLFSYLNARGIFPQYHYIPIFKFSFYKKNKIKNYNGALKFYRNSISLPMYFSLTRKDQIYIINKLLQFSKLK